MYRKLLGGCALVAALAFTVGCGGSSSSGLSKEELEKKSKENMEMMKKNMPGAGGAAPGGAAPAPMGGGTVPMTDPAKK